ncbi:MAG: endonuclease III domain-containing protein [Desulfovibrio sp.]
MTREQALMNMFKDMHNALGDSHWWPGDTPFEIMIGTVLVQNTNWKNVEKAIANLKAAQIHTPQDMRNISADDLAELIRPAGFFRVKTDRLQHVLRYLKSYNDDFDFLKTGSLHSRREELLAVKGIGPETADSILLYALDFPVFVVDAYTKRMFNRHGMLPEDVFYPEMQDYFMDVLPADTKLFNEFHALIVRVGKEWCKKSRPLCSECPLSSYL